MKNLNRKNSFDDYGAEPSPLVWEKIEKRLPAPRGKKRGWLIWSMAAILITGIFLSAYLLDIEIKLKRKEAAENSSTAHITETNTGVKKIPAEKNQTQLTGKKITESVKDNDDTGQKVSSENSVSSQAAENGRRENKILAEEPGIVRTKIKTKKIAEENKTIQTENVVVRATEPVVDERAFIENIPAINLTMIPISSNDASPMRSAPFSEILTVKKKHSVSRWQILISGGENYNYRILNFPSSANTTISEGEKNYLSGNEKGIQTFSFETGIGYSLSTHFNLNFGINYFTAGQERSQSQIIFTSGIVGTSNALYSVNTSAGVLSASGQQLDVAYYQNSDSTLFIATSSLTGAPSPQDSSITKNFTLRQEFSFIGFPLLIQYQPAEHRFTPYIGLGVSAGYILKERVTVNDKELDYDYRQTTNTIIFFAEAQAGVKYRISNHLFFKLQPSLRYGLNSLNGDDSIEWIPYSAGVGAGINFRF